MGQFKPMIKMETTEPSIELKLKKGGHATHKAMKKGGKAEHGHKKMADGGALAALAGTPALIGRPAVNAPVQAPGKPSMMARRKAMMAAPAAPVMGGRMKEGGKAEGGMESKADERKEDKMDMSKDKAMIKKAFKEHDAQEHKGGKGTHLNLKKGGKTKKMATGGVALSNGGGYRKGGSVADDIPEEETSGKYDTTIVHQASKRNPKVGTGGVKDGNGGGFKKGGKVGAQIPEEESYGNYDKTLVHQASKRNPRVGTEAVKDSNAGGYKKGGATKKHFATGGAVNNAGRAVAMPQGSKKAPTPVMISQLSGTYRTGGKVTRPEAALLKVNKEENSASMKAAKKYSVDPDPMILPASRMKRGGRC